MAAGSQDKVIQVSFRCKESVYLAYKQALLRRQEQTGKRQNTTQHLTETLIEFAEEWGTLSEGSENE